MLTANKKTAQEIYLLYHHCAVCQFILCKLRNIELGYIISVGKVKTVKILKEFAEGDFSHLQSTQIQSG